MTHDESTKKAVKRLWGQISPHGTVWGDWALDIVEEECRVHEKTEALKELQGLIPRIKDAGYFSPPAVGRMKYIISIALGEPCHKPETMEIVAKICRLFNPNGLCSPDRYNELADIIEGKNE